MEPTDVLVYRATLPHPTVGINQTYEVGTGTDGTARYFKSAKAKAWATDTTSDLIAQGLKSLPAIDGMWWISLRTAIFTRRRDVDGHIKGLQDVIVSVMGCDDKLVGHVESIKVFVKSDKDQSLIVRLLAFPVAHLGDHRTLSLRMLAEDLPLKVITERDMTLSDHFQPYSKATQAGRKPKNEVGPLTEKPTKRSRSAPKTPPVSSAVKPAAARSKKVKATGTTSSTVRKAAPRRKKT